MTLPNCCRCNSQPCKCDEIKTTLKRLILAEVTTRGRISHEQIEDIIWEMYRRAGMRCPLEHMDEAIRSLVYGRRIRRTEGKWEDDYWYTIRKPARQLEQKMMFT